MAFGEFAPEFRVTETQRLIASVALGISSGEGPGAIHPLDPKVEDLVRAMVIIQKAGMQAYLLRGFDWSCRTRARQEAEQVKSEQGSLDEAVECFNQVIDYAHGQAASRIRANRVRRIRDLERELGLPRGEILRHPKEVRQLVERLVAQGYDDNEALEMVQNVEGDDYHGMH